ncbi:MAG: hypothetical protein ABIH21_01080 [Patescibacteria group bacterium]
MATSDRDKALLAAQKLLNLLYRGDIHAEAVPGIARLAKLISVIGLFAEQGDVTSQELRHFIEKWIRPDEKWPLSKDLNKVVEAFEENEWKNIVTENDKAGQAACFTPLQMCRALRWHVDLDETQKKQLENIPFRPTTISTIFEQGGTLLPIPNQVCFKNLIKWFGMHMAHGLPTFSESFETRPNLCSSFLNLEMETQWSLLVPADHDEARVMMTRSGGNAYRYATALECILMLLLRARQPKQYQLSLPEGPDQVWYFCDSGPAQFSIKVFIRIDLGLILAVPADELQSGETLKAVHLLAKTPNK